jgi:hypothetical protein
MEVKKQSLSLREPVQWWKALNNRRAEYAKSQAENKVG